MGIGVTEYTQILFFAVTELAEFKFTQLTLAEVQHTGRN